MSRSVNWVDVHFQQILVEVPQLIVQMFDFLPSGSCVFIFFACAKKTEPKESTPCDLPALRVHSAHPCASPFGQPSAARIGFLPIRPCASRRHWRKNKLARFAPSNKFLLDPMKAAMLGCIEGMKINTPDSEPYTLNTQPSALSTQH